MKISELTEAFRSAMVQVLVPELKELKVEINERFMQLHKEMDERFQKVDERFMQLHKEMDERFKKVDERFEKMDEKFEKMMDVLVSIKLDVSEMKAKEKQIDWLTNRVMRLEDGIENINKRLAAA